MGDNLQERPERMLHIGQQGTFAEVSFLSFSLTGLPEGMRLLFPTLIIKFMFMISLCKLYYFFRVESGQENR